MTFTTENKNMANESMYDCEYDGGFGDLAREYDSMGEEFEDDACYDGAMANRYDDSEYDSDEDWTVVPETLSHRATQVAPPARPAWMGLQVPALDETDMDAFFKKMADEQKEKDEKDKAEKEARRTAEEERLKAEEVRSVQAALPSFSRGYLAKQAALEQERVEKQEAAKLVAAKLALENKKPQGQSKLPFGHRRNGGGKHRTKEVDQSQAARAVAGAVMALRRTVKRKEHKETKRVAEVQRAADFENRGITAGMKSDKTSEIQIEHSLLPSVDEEERKAERVELERARQALVEKADREAVEEEKKAKAEAEEKKAKAESARAEAEEAARKKKEEQEDLEQLLSQVAPRVVKLDATEAGWETAGRKRKLEKPPRASEKKTIETNFRVGEATREQTRERAMATLADEQQLRDRKAKTKMCQSVGTGKPCRHGDQCRFAHSTEELSISDCFFGNRCNFVHQRIGLYHNKSSKMCTHIHPGETQDNFYSRTNLPDPRKSQQKTAIKTVVAPQRTSAKEATPMTPRTRPTTTTPPPAPRKAPRPTTIEEKTRPTPCPPPFPLEEETVLRVPKELAMQAMELAMKSGNKRIRVEII